MLPAQVMAAEAGCSVPAGPFNTHEGTTDNEACCSLALNDFFAAGDQRRKHREKARRF